MNIVFEYNAA